MKTLWNLRFEIMIALSGCLMIGNILLPGFLHEGVYNCLLLVFLLAIILLTLQNIDHNMKSNMHGGGIL